MQAITNSHVLKAISDNASLEILKAIATASKIDSNSLRKIQKITRKQYYSRLSALTAAELVKRKNGKYFLTSLGKIVYRVVARIEESVNNQWKLQVVDSISDIPKEEQEKIIRSLVGEMTGTREKIQVLTHGIQTSEYTSESGNV